MSLPLHTITPTPVRAAFVAPLDEPYLPLEEAVLGGTAIGDPSQGRQVQRWTVFYDSGFIKVAPESGAVAFSMAVAGVTTVSLDFDSNMAVAIAYQTASGSHLYYFDSLLGHYNTLDILGATSCRVGVDDKRLFNASASDVIFSYTLDDKLYYREQRDRYTVERLVGPSIGILLRSGQNVLNRFQWKLGQYIAFTP